MVPLQSIRKRLFKVAYGVYLCDLVFPLSYLFDNLAYTNYISERSSDRETLNDMK